MTPAVPLASDALAELPGIRHGFFTRQGGVSSGVYASLNCGLGSGDDLGAVRENRARAMAALGLPGDALATAYQRHSARVILVEEPWSIEARPEVDALVARRPGIAIGILAADCAPVLLADPEARIVAAAHAGWRGALAGVVDAAVEGMVAAGARRQAIRAAIGPAIAQVSYEVGTEFHERFLAEDTTNAAFFRPSARVGHFMFDLPGYLAKRLAGLGLARVESLARDTYAEADLFFSYRRTAREGSRDYGRILSAIALA